MRYGLEMKIICSNNKINQIKTLKWCNKNGISFESCAFNTHAQNGRAEQFKQLIIKKARAIKLSVNLLYILWRKIATAAAYLYNQTFRASNNWMLSYKVFHTHVFDKDEISGPRKPFLHHFKTYGYKAYVLTKSKSDINYCKKYWKLDKKANIGFFIRYQLINILPDMSSTQEKDNICQKHCFQ